MPKAETGITSTNNNSSSYSSSAPAASPSSSLNSSPATSGSSKKRRNARKKSQSTTKSSSESLTALPSVESKTVHSSSDAFMIEEKQTICVSSEESNRVTSTSSECASMKDIINAQTTSKKTSTKSSTISSSTQESSEIDSKSTECQTVNSEVKSNSCSIANQKVLNSLSIKSKDMVKSTSGVDESVDSSINGSHQMANELKMNGHYDDMDMNEQLSSSSRNSECDWNGSDIYMNGNDCDILTNTNETTAPNVFNGRYRHEYTVDVAKLKSQYANNTKHEKASCKQIINTGIDFKSLKHNYSQNALSSDTVVSKNSFNKHHITTGVDIRSLKTSFNETNGHQEDGIKIDTSKAQKRFSQDIRDDLTLCAVCEKHVYLMDKVKAEKKSYHKSCFRCKQCNKQLNMDNYQSHEGELYCQPHFKLLLQPKPKFESEDIAQYRQRRNEMIIRENTPVELPPDVVRYDAKVDDGLDTLQLNLTNIRQRFESGADQDRLSSTSPILNKGSLQRSESLQIRLARYQSAAAGDKMSDNAEDQASESSDTEGEITLVRETKKKEKVPFAGLSSLRTQWESGTVPKGESPSDEPPREDETKGELYKLRQRICLGRSASMRQMYEKACTGATPSASPSPRPPESLNIESSVKAGSLKEKFERGEIDNETTEERMDRFRNEKEEDLKSALEAETAAREAKNLFKQLDATLVKSATNSAISAMHNHNHHTSQSVNRQIRGTHATETLFRPTEVIKCADPKVKEEVVIETKDVQERYKFFECYQENGENARKRNGVSPTWNGDLNASDAVDTAAEPRVEILPDANIIHQDNIFEEIPKIETTAKMLNKFKQLENQNSIEQPPPSGLKPLKRITPPREFTKDVIESEPSIERDPNIVKSSYKTEDVIPVEPKLARSLTAKFENWNSFDVEKENKRNSIPGDEEVLPQVDITKNLRAKFEAIQDEYIKPTEKSKPKVNRFVSESAGNNTEDCSICGKRLYPMEKLEFSGMKMHKNCFKCSHCFSSLRLENYTLAAGKFYCIIHFKQLFMSKGNYDEGFGVEQHKEKWRNRAPSRSSGADSDTLSPEEEDKDSIYTDQISV